MSSMGDSTILANPPSLEPEHIDVVRATLPVIGGNIETIARVFYQRLFSAHPELIADTFNRGNQKQGAQQKALAASVATFASMLIEGQSPVQLLARIGHKHASVGITEDQYQIVHDHLFAAIVEVLGEAITPEVAAGWDRVYWIMAQVLVDYEKGLYAEAGVVPGDVFRKARVVGHTIDTPTVASYELEAAKGADPLPDFRPGQYTSVGVRLPDGARQLRQYSLSNAPGQGRWRISVRRVDAGEFPAGEVSTWLHEQLRVGDELQVTLPFGDLILNTASNGPVVLASAGIGITPMLGMLAYLATQQPDRPVTVLHADRSPQDHVLHEEVSAEIERLSAADVHTWYEEEADQANGPGQVASGYMDLSGIDVPEGTDVYLCGPAEFLQALRPAFLDRGVPAERINAELFAPNDWLLG